MFRPHVLQVTDESVNPVYGQGVPAEWLGQNDNILLQQGLPLESSFDTQRCDGKTTTASKGSLP
jgi:hypothetical protein